MTLKDLKTASAARKAEGETEAAPQGTPATSTAVSDGRTKLLGARVPLAVHREFQGQLFRAQERFPDLTTQAAMPALVRLLRDEAVWQKFMAELERS